jgi:hypothetical protein
MPELSSTIATAKVRRGFEGMELPNEKILQAMDSLL